LLEDVQRWIFDNVSNIFYLISGSVLTLLGSWFVESRSRHSERADERREKIYAPFYDELSAVETALRNCGRTGRSCWGEYNRIKNAHILYMIPRNLREKITHLIEGDLEEFDRKSIELQDTYEKKIAADLMQAMPVVSASPGATARPSLAPEVADLTRLAVYLVGGILPQGESRSNLDAALESIKVRSNMTYNSVEEFFEHYLAIFRSDEEYRALNKQKEHALGLAREIKAEIGRNLEAQS